MSVGTDTIVRAWTDQSFREALPEDLLRQIPDSPAGEFQEILSFSGSQAIEASTVSVVCLGSCYFTFGDSSDDCCAY